MRPDRWKRINQILDDLKQLPEGERKAAIPSLCKNDSELELELRAMLEAEQTRPAGFLADESDADPLVGQTFGDYRLLECIGRGSAGDVYRSCHEETGEIAALKILRDPTSDQSRRIERFYREAETAARLFHPNVVLVQAFGVERGTPFYAMNYIEGETLAQRQQRQRPTPHEAARWTGAIARALHYAHEQGLIHRDVKPQNIMLDQQENPLLLDFGIAKDVGATTLTRPDEVQGTPYYMSPEQARTLDVQLDGRSDVYSLGAVMYELLSGRRSAQGDTPAQILGFITNENPVHILDLRSGLPRDLGRVCMTALQREPEHRYRTAAEFADQLEAFLANKPVRARDRRLALKARAWTRRHSRTIMAAALVTFSLFLWLVVGSRGDALVAATKGAYHIEGEATAIRMQSVGSAGLLAPPRTVPRDGLAEPGHYRFSVVAASGTRQFNRSLLPGRTTTISVESVRESTIPDVRIPAGNYSVRLPCVTANGKLRFVTETVHYSAFRIDRRCVTNREFDAFLGSTDPERQQEWRRWSGEPPTDSWWDLPATKMTLELARAYAESVGKRLPTYAEWQTAMGGPRPAWWDDSLLDRCNIGHPQDVPGGASGSTRRGYLRYALPAGAGPAIGAHSLLGVVGNVFEWTDSPTPVWDEGEWATSATQSIVVGTAWFTSKERVRSHPLGSTNYNPNNMASIDLGFRCISPEPNR